jgi:FkbM family methyltransferase
MYIKSTLKKIWTASPQSIFYSFIKSNNDVKINKIKITNGVAKNIFLNVPKQNSGIYFNMANGNYENYILNVLLEHNAIQNKNIWDIGAHIGYHSLVFAKYTGPKGQITAFEPNPKVRNILKENINSNPDLSTRIIIREEALSNIIGNEKMLISESGYQTTSSGGYLGNITPPLNEKNYKNFKQINVKINTVDNLIQNEKLTNPDLIKIDVEGAELKLLEGALKTLETVRPILIIEIHTIAMMFYIQKLLLKYKYKINIIDEKIEGHTKNILALPK